MHPEIHQGSSPGDQTGKRPSVVRTGPQRLCLRTPGVRTRWKAQPGSFSEPWFPHRSSRVLRSPSLTGDGRRGVHTRGPGEAQPGGQAGRSLEGRHRSLPVITPWDPHAWGHVPMLAPGARPWGQGTPHDWRQARGSSHTPPAGQSPCPACTASSPLEGHSGLTGSCRRRHKGAVLLRG